MAYVKVLRDVIKTFT